MLNTKVLVFERERESHGSEKKDLEMLCCVGRKTKTNNGSGHRGSVVLCWFYFNFLGMCFVFVFIFNSLFRFNLMFLFVGIVIFGF